MFLPINKKELLNRGVDRPDFVVVSGDAYVDHPSFGHAVIARFLESEGFSVGIIAQPTTDMDYQEFGEPRLGFMVTSGVVDSMVNNYYVTKKRRTADEYSEGGRTGKRPDRALSVYCKKLRELYPHSSIVAGGLEASLRRLAHYDYWADTVMPSILVDTEADLIVYGMGEMPLLEICAAARRNIPIKKLRDIKGTAYLTDKESAPKIARALEGGDENYVLINSFDRVRSDKRLYHKAFLLADNAVNIKKGVIQKQSYTHFAVVNPPALAVPTDMMDRVYSLPFMRKAHPIYTDGVPAIEEVEFSITAHRGCFGNCAFCALTYHQGKEISKRSKDSIVDEAKQLVQSPDFKGYIHDVGGATANFHNPPCRKNSTHGGCNNKECIGNDPCKNLVADHREYLDILRTVRNINGVKKVFIRSGVRFDYLMLDQNNDFFKELVAHHISGQLKVAPEHVSDNVLKAMNKPPFKVYKSFSEKYKRLNKEIGKNQFLVPYFISSHPGSTLEDAVKLYDYLVSINHSPLQVQDFYPTPGTRATTMYYTDLDMQGNPIYTAKTEQEKAMQRALMQPKNPKNKELIAKALEIVRGKKNDASINMLPKRVNSIKNNKKSSIKGKYTDKKPTTKGKKGR